MSLHHWESSAYSGSEYFTWLRSRGHYPGLHTPLVCQATYISFPSTFEQGSFGIFPNFIDLRTERDIIFLPPTALSLYSPNRTWWNHWFFVGTLPSVSPFAYLSMALRVATLSWDATLRDPPGIPPLAEVIPGVVVAGW